MTTYKTLRRTAISLFLCLFALLPVHAQYERLGGVYYAYPADHTQMAEAPEGYEPFYISHYGRHGSRWLPSDQRYEWVMSHFEDASNLTKLGKSVRKRLAKIWRNARGNGGRLTPLGGRQHEAIATRMYHNFPQLFTTEARLTAHSSTVDRCRQNMLHFVSRLQALNPQLCITPVTSEEDMAWIAYTSPEEKALENRTRIPLGIDPHRLTRALFIDDSKVEQPDKLLSELHTIASDMQDVELRVSLYDIFTEEELHAVYAANNERMTICNGDVPSNDGIPARSAVSLWRRIEAKAEAAIASRGLGADLRFGHDTNLYRLLTLMQVNTNGMGMDEILPMAANLQMIFYRNEAGDVKVQLLHNEKSIGFYSWQQLKEQVNSRIHYLEHIRQLSALNTMVGTAPANTRTAGLFGKGSEEHGQTLPAVLVPNGQTFWTPQTQTTERKCIAPYYYQDSLFYGIRASHWLVGGCTQDYGSFTVGAFKGGNGEGSLATPFSHGDETSHPNYYALSLPREQMMIELTALSHAAIMHVTPLYDGLADIVLTVNSDEQQATISMQDGRVYASNPVHRIYQGWGEPAGFSGHFVLQFSDSLVASRQEGQTLRLTFKAVSRCPIVLRMATSFTSREGAERNLEAEARCTFNQMQQQCADIWVKRLHTIDVSDPDTALVNQFYGALYRASFLPREMSDADGCYPRFAGNANCESPSRKSYGDFSMWDTYRALHPLLCIIAPEENGNMMQSLVNMATEGGWLPIFPCWNSYTAAMIGDHCSSVLADAYVKGIRGFDARAAYSAMRQNAFSTPSPQDYLDGKGRRALTSYLQYGYIPLEDSVKEAFHQQEQTSRTLEYAYDDFCVAQMAHGLQTTDSERDFHELMQRAENWRNVINPTTGYADGRHADGSWEGNGDLVHRKPYITEGATCHYTWYVPHNSPGLIELMGGREAFVQKLDSMFTEGRYWHGNEPCHQVAWLYSLAGRPDLTRQRTAHILQTEYNDSPGGLSGNDDAGQMSAWQLFASMGFYPVCPGTPQYVLGGAWFQEVTINSPAGRSLTIRRSPDGLYSLNGQALDQLVITHDHLLRGGTLLLPGSSSD
ncbi:MAG: GH92 family glycosyl hydrolase [Prevotella sp.]|nr:GH92 family glycosyl hydrolase [Prevotella sp.]